jgi:pilus assembly protein Flp/PilA
VVADGRRCRPIGPAVSDRLADAAPGQRCRTFAVVDRQSPFATNRQGVPARRPKKELHMFNTLLIRVQTVGKQLRHSDRGASMVEYGLLVALIAVIVAVAAGPLGTAIAQLFTDVTNSL